MLHRSSLSILFKLSEFLFFGFGFFIDYEKRSMDSHQPKNTFETRIRNSQTIKSGHNGWCYYATRICSQSLVALNHACYIPRRISFVPNC